MSTANLVLHACLPLHGAMLNKLETIAFTENSKWLTPAYLPAPFQVNFISVGGSHEIYFMYACISVA